MATKNVAPKTYLHKKRIVFTALSPYFEGDKLMQAMVIWDQKYSHGPSSFVQNFVYDLKNSVDAYADIRGAHLNLIRCSTLPEKKLLKDPSGSIEKYIHDNKLSDNAAFSHPEFETLQVFIYRWRTQLTWMENKMVTTFLVDNIGRQKLQPVFSLYFLSWIMEHEETVQLPNVNIIDLHKIINLFYNASCEIAGPVKTMDIITKTIDEFKHQGGARYRILVDKLLLKKIHQELENTAML